jgi:hypothetical protein
MSNTIYQLVLFATTFFQSKIAKGMASFFGLGKKNADK